MKYDAWKFAQLAETDFGTKLWEFLNEQDTFIRMETATRLYRPAVEGIAKELLIRFKDDFASLEASDYLRIKQMIGHMTKQVMARHGYHVYMKNVRVITSNLFSKGTRYSKGDEDDS
ncbi:hypothetical protein JEZ13_05515 [bacterium]|nr:hypothetical protein [bacterium]